VAAQATKLPDATELAIERTRLAHERTLMAWVRTAVSLISFGFTIYKFFEYLVQQGAAKASPHLLGPRRYGIMMILAGLVSLVLATVQHWRYMHQLRRQTKEAVYSLATLMAAVVAALGLAALILVYFNQ
jgi:putative membrane protein